MLHTFINSYFYSATFNQARLRDYIFLYSVNRTFCLLWFADLSSQLQCRSAAEPGSFYLVPGSHHQIFCYITLKNTLNLFDSFYSVFFEVTLFIFKMIASRFSSHFLRSFTKEVRKSCNLFEQFIYHFRVLTFDLICYQALEHLSMF